MRSELPGCCECCECVLEVCCLCFGNIANPNIDLGSKKGHGTVFIFKITAHYSFFFFLSFLLSQITKQYDLSGGLFSA